MEKETITGDKNITARLVKDSAELICPTLTNIFESSCSKGFSLNISKIATFFPIPAYKNIEKSDCSNYRPISALSTVAKILEKLFIIH